jgi:RND family efflux transporter MFP subunit
MTASQNPDHTLIELPAKPTRKQHLQWLALSGLVLLTLLIYLLSNWQSPPPIPDTAPAPRLPVSVTEVSPALQPLSLSTTGITASRWLVDITATIDGQVVSLPEQIEVSAQVSSQSLLAQLNPVSYEAEVAQAQSRLAQARVQLARIKHERTVTLKLSNGQLKTPFARYEIQLSAAKADVQAAESNLVLAKQRLSDTHIKAPFDAVLLKKYLAPGQWVSSGQPLFQVASSRSLDINVALSEQQWQLLSELEAGWQTEVITRTGQTWNAEVRYFSPNRDHGTRQRHLVLAVASPFDALQPLLPAQQVRVVFKGTPTQPLSSIPASSLTRDENVWRVNQEGLLIQDTVELIQEINGTALVRFVKHPQEARHIVLYPLRSMLEGQAVTIRTGIREAISKSESNEGERK